MSEPTEKSIAQVAYETFLEEIAKTEDAVEAASAPPWERVPQHVRAVIASAVAAAVRNFAPALVPETTAEEQSFAQVGYQAYVASTGGLNYQGLPCPEWSKLTDAVRAAWSAAAVAIRSEHEHDYGAQMARLEGPDSFGVVLSREQVTELVAGLDALQRADKHQGEVTFPLRSRLRGLLSRPEPATNVASEAPQVDSSETIADDALDPVGAATESPPAERTDPAPSAETTPEAGTPETNVVASAQVELPAVSEAPAAPPFPAPDPAIPPSPALPTDTGPQMPPAAG